MDYYKTGISKDDKYWTCDNLISKQMNLWEGNISLRATLEIENENN